MKVTVEELSPSKRALHVELPSDRVAAQIEATFREWGRKLQLPGFRRGKVPHEIIRRRFQSEVQDEVLRELIPDSFREAVAQTALQPVGQPTLEDVHFHEGEPLTYKAVVEVKPAVTVTDYRGLAVERDKVEVADQEVDRALEFLREEAAEFIPMEGWPAMRDDLVILDHEGTVNGRPFKGSSGTNVILVLGRGEYLPGLEEQIAGMQKGDRKQFSLAIPAEYPRKELAGRTVEFRVTVKEVKKRRLPEVDAEFAKSAGDVETVDALRSKLRQQLLDRKTRAQEAELKRALLDKLSAGHEVELPEAMVEREAAAILEEMLMTIRAAGGRVEGLPESPEAVRAQAQDAARRRVKESLLLEAVARQEGLTVTDEELDAEVARVASAYRQDVAAMRRSILEDPNRREAMTVRLLERKALDLLYQQATVTESYRLITPA